MKDEIGSTALFCACSYGCADIARILLDRGAAVAQSLVEWFSACML